MEINKWKILFILTVIIGVWLLGFFLGRKSITNKAEVVTEYVYTKPIRDSIPYPVPYKVVEPIDTINIIKQCIKDGIYAELWPTKTITEYIEITKEDTTVVLKDWATKRYYQETLFESDTLGKCTFNAELQYNRMKVIGYEYTPITKIVTETKYNIKTFSPFLGVGATFNPWDEVRDPMFTTKIGFFVKEKYGLELNYQHALTSKHDYIGGAILFKF